MCTLYSTRGWIYSMRQRRPCTKRRINWQFVSNYSQCASNSSLISLSTDSSSDSASHTHSARRPSAAALLTRSRGHGLTTTPRTLPHSDTHSLLRDCDGRLLPLALPLSLSLTRCWGAGSSSLADVEKRKGEVKRPSREALGSKTLSSVYVVQ